jgi:hypothetical protein
MRHPSIRSEVRTRALSRGALLLITLLSIPLTTRASVSIPDTPAGHTLQAFLNAFNTSPSPCNGQTASEKGKLQERDCDENPVWYHEERTQP